MRLTEIERKYLVRLKQMTFDEGDRHFKSARHTLHKLAGKGFVRRVDVYGSELLLSDTSDDQVIWEITDAGLSAL